VSDNEKKQSATERDTRGDEKEAPQTASEGTKKAQQNPMIQKILQVLELDPHMQALIAKYKDAVADFRKLGGQVPTANHEVQGQCHIQSYVQMYTDLDQAD
jgi:hypothetical protein